MKGPSNARLQEIAVDYIAAIENLKKAESLWWYSVENDFEEQFGLAVSGSIEAANRLTNSGMTFLTRHGEDGSKNLRHG
jgi:hypothetical protein